MKFTVRTMTLYTSNFKRFQ